MKTATVTLSVDHWNRIVTMAEFGLGSVPDPASNPEEHMKSVYAVNHLRILVEGEVVCSQPPPDKP